MPRVVPERRKLEYGKEASGKSKDKPEEKHLVQRDGRFNGILARNCRYREDARNWMKATGFYDDKIQIKRGIRNQVTYNKLTNKKEKLSYVNERIEFYTFEYENKDEGWKGVLNFTRPCGRPYGNAAHHILACNLFYKKEWAEKPERLTIVKECGYDINNEGNIIYLPIEDVSCFYHDLPNHRDGHPQYNKKCLTYTKKILDKVDEAITKKKCDEEKKKLLKELFDMFIKIEDIMYKIVTKKGQRSLSPRQQSTPRPPRRLSHKKGRK